MEISDTLGTVHTASSSVECLANNWGVADVVLIPFAHLSSDLLAPADAVSMLEAFSKEIQTLGLSVRLASFGYHKDFALTVDAFGHPGSVAYREFPSPRRSQTRK